jgi:hypothetical protein
MLDDRTNVHSAISVVDVHASSSVSVRKRLLVCVLSIDSALSVTVIYSAVFYSLILTIAHMRLFDMCVSE